MDLVASLHRRTHELIGRLASAGLLKPAVEATRSSVLPSPVGSPHDFVLDAALVHAQDIRAAGAGPAWLAQTLAAEVTLWPEVEAAAASGPGFVEVSLRPAARFGVIHDILRRGAPGGAAASPGLRRTLLGEGISLAEARAAVLADVVANLLAASGSATPPVGDGAAAPRCGPVVVAHRRDPPGYADVAAAVGADAFRIAAVSRRPDATLRLDLDALRERARANAAFWLPYVHARSRTLLRRVALAAPQRDLGPSGLARADLGALTDADDLALLRLLVMHAHQMSRAASTRLPHLFKGQLCALADGVDGQWSGSKDQPQLRFVNEQRRYSTEARLALVTASTLVLGSGLGILGVATPDEMP